MPPDTAFQKVHFNKIEPEPSSVVVDQDGNWLASYTLKARERIDIAAVGAVQIYANPRPFLKPSQDTLKENTQVDKYWEVNDPQIRKLAATFKSPAEIYDFVIRTLKYDYESVRPNVVRKGAKESLNNPGSAICMEFTDLFIALTRAKGIPAREINGFAYTENPEIQPLSLVADVLHAWPEYWSEEKGAWIPVDPTWGATTGGVDYFSKLDLRHFTFVIHGSDSSKPYPPGSYKLGPNPQKDVFVNFGQLPKELKSDPEILVETKPMLPIGPTRLAITIKNPGPLAIYRLVPKVLFDNKVVETGFATVIPPYGKYEMLALIPFSFLGRKTPNEVKIEALDKTVIVPSIKNQVIIYNLIILSLLLGGAVFIVLVKTGKLNLARLKPNLDILKRLKRKADKDAFFGKQAVKKDAEQN